MVLSQSGILDFTDGEGADKALGSILISVGIWVGWAVAGEGAKVWTDFEAISMWRLSVETVLFSRVMIRAGEKAYTKPKSSHDIDRLSATQAFSSGLGDTKMGTLFRAAAKMSTRGVLAENRLSKFYWVRHHSVGLGLLILDNMSFVMLQVPVWIWIWIST